MDFGDDLWSPEILFGWTSHRVCFMSLSWNGVANCGKSSYSMIWVWVNTYRYMTLVGWTSINPSYDLGWTKGTRVLTHPHIPQWFIATCLDFSTKAGRCAYLMCFDHECHGIGLGYGCASICLGQNQPTTNLNWPQLIHLKKEVKQEVKI